MVCSRVTMRIHTSVGVSMVKQGAEMTLNKKGNVGINVVLMRVLATIVEVEKQYVLHILSVCL